MSSYSLHKMSQKNTPFLLEMIVIAVCEYEDDNPADKDSGSQQTSIPCERKQNKEPGLHCKVRGKERRSSKSEQGVITLECVIRQDAPNRQTEREYITGPGNKRSVRQTINAKSDARDQNKNRDNNSQLPSAHP